MQALEALLCFVPHLPQCGQRPSPGPGGPCQLPDPRAELCVHCEDSWASHAGAEQDWVRAGTSWLWLGCCGPGPRCEEAVEADGTDCPLPGAQTPKGTGDTPRASVICPTHLPGHSCVLTP